jgi:pyridine nucleotide-disulfide oxidoreductase family protein
MSTVVLVGAGHAHALVLDAWRKHPIKAVDLVLVAPMLQAPYSGMIPGWLAGQYPFEEAVVDFEGLCQRSGARFVQAELLRLDPDAQTVWLSNGQSLAYDWLSLNVGSTLVPPISDTRVLSMRPLATLRGRYESWLAHWQAVTDTRPLSLTAVGGGAAGIESLLCVQHRLKQLRPDKPVHARLITRSANILPGFSARARQLALEALHRASITVELGTDWSETIDTNSDLVIWATGAQAHAWQLEPSTRGTLQTDLAGFISVDNRLCSLSHANIFAVGDCAALPGKVPKAGVYAVRMGSTLARNLQSALMHQPLVDFEGQGRALALLNTADGSAIASWGPLGWRGRWVMRWKDRIDRGFIKHFVCG